MSPPFQADRIDSEKPDLHEASSSTFLAVPFTLWTCLVIFGCAYMVFHTHRADWSEGDKRTPKSAATTAVNASQDMAKLGADLYKRHCQVCHQPTGLGVGAAFPPLKDSEWVLGPPEVVPGIIAHGLKGEIQVQGKTFKGVMPGFKDKVSSQEIAAIAGHIRNSWGNQAPEVPVEVVDKVLEDTAGRTEAWTSDELKEKLWN